jgi:hypothetical protein
MYEHNEEVILAGVAYPIRCNINVLIEIQDRYNTLDRFEAELTGIDVKRGADGRAVKDNDGKIQFIRRTPSLRAVRDILPFMLSEGIKGDSRLDSDDYEKALAAVNNVVFDRYKVVLAMHKEYSKCFERKNQQSAKVGTEETQTTG